MPPADARSDRPLPVTLSSDFGVHYPAAMRGVLARRGIERILDLTHDLPRQDVRQSAFWLQELLPYQPPAVHCIVVDPGVGTDRDVLVVRAGVHLLVGPDNGVLWPAARRLGDDGPIESYRFDHVAPASRTFHGRDVFAPVAAAVATLGLTEFTALPTLRVADHPTDLTMPEPIVMDDATIATVLAVDGFGNAITNLEGERFASHLGTSVRVDGRSTPMAASYGAVDPGTALVTIGSHGRVELAVNQGRATAAFEVAVGDEVRIAPEPDR